MPNKLAVIFLFVLLTIIPAYAASPEQPNSVPLDPNLLQTFIDKANKGDSVTQYHLGFMYDFGVRIQQDYNEAFKWYTKAAEQGDAQAQFNLGLMYDNGKGVPQDYKEAVKWFRKAAEQGDASAQCGLGVMYAKGEGVPQDYKEAIKWWRKAAEQSDAMAQWYLGEVYRGCKGVPQDFNEAIKWYRKAAEQDEEKAQFMVGLLYYIGNGVSQDYQEAFKWLRKSAEKGDARSQYFIGSMYSAGDGIAQDYNEAVKWYKKAAEQDDETAQAKLGAMYYKGVGVAPDSREAFKWFRRAAEQGNADAQSILGGIYEVGKGVTQDYVEAYKWLILAAAQGDQVAIKDRDRLNRKMSPPQIAEAQKLAKEFKPIRRNNSDAIEDMAEPKKGDTVISSGTGFFITPDGFIVTAYHVVKDSTKVKLVTNDGIKTAVVVKFDSTNDIAILKAENAQYISLPIKSSMGVKLGADVFTVGFPNVQLQGFEPKYTKGNISSLSGIQDDPRHFQVSTPVQPGNSGGPLIDSMGNVIGIIDTKMGDVETLEATGSIPQNVNYAIKSTFGLALLETVPDASQNLKPLSQKERSPADVVDEAQKAVVLILCY